MCACIVDMLSLNTAVSVCNCTCMLCQTLATSQITSSQYCNE